MNTFNTTCPECHSSLDVPSHYLNQNIKCGGCGIDFIASKNSKITTGSKSSRKKSRLTIPDRKLMVGDEEIKSDEKDNGLRENICGLAFILIIVCVVCMIFFNWKFLYLAIITAGFGVAASPDEKGKKSKLSESIIIGVVFSIVGVVIVYGISYFISYRIDEGKKEDKAKAERIAKYRANKETSVTNSGWDGSVSQVKSWLKSNVKDPSSLDFIEWSEVERISSGYRVRVKYRAKNSFGALVIENKIFYMNSDGSVTRSTDY